MRVDKFMNITNIVKKRSIAQDMCESGVISVNGVIVKASREVKVDDVIELRYLNRVVQYKVLQIPLLKSIPKSQSQKYVMLNTFS
ncbi:RNA-binding S4 domain-containing protein [Helicobacter sp. 13S00477-4]|uniref:RNA-binding S4 domain-containing protein n=1 Tax=Helicobacter sp. 13S00477-4 TaxID=1905759 RepID=UPI000BA5F413|nr:RNA-binding S4 domain-containing protein [Helicobacter sp. 13S00477-4]PAF52141.1 hypothetical protein BKH44_03300 [Helicobacter sp. 13S00477-4]